MDWLQSSQICHQVLGERPDNHRKGYKTGDQSRHFDPDKSDTPLLHDNPSTPDRENSEDDWSKFQTGDLSPAEKKHQNLFMNSSSSSSQSLKGNIKSKSSSTQVKSYSNRSPRTGYDGKPSESEKLLIDFGDNANTEEIGSVDDDDEGWSVPHPAGRYHKVHSGAD